MCSLKAEDLAKLPDPLYTLLGRMWGYLDAVDPEAHRLSVSMVAAQEAHGVQVTSIASEAMQLDDDQPPHCHGPLLVGPHAVCLKARLKDVQEEVCVYFYHCPGPNVVLVHTPADPQGLCNLFPGDTGLRVASPTLRSLRVLDEAWAGPRAYQWGQWLAGALALPARLAGVAPDYSAACLLDRLVVRLRTRRLLHTHMAQLCAAPPYVPLLDPAADRGLLPELGLQEGEGWQLVKCVELPKAQVPHGLFEPPHDQGHSTQAQQQDEPMIARAPGTSRADEGPRQAWERVGARYLELGLGVGKQAERRAVSLTAYVEICPEYPVRPPTLRLGPLGTGARKAASLAVLKDAETEANAYSEALLADHPNSRDWLLSHQVHRLLVCLNNQGSGSVRGGGTRRTSRGTYNQDVHTRLMLPR